MVLKVFDLQCENNHIFEGWFGSHEDYDVQQARGLVTCPLCQSCSIEKRLSAPRLNLGRFDDAQNQARRTQPEQLSAPAGRHVDRQDAIAASSEIAQIQATMLAQMREIISQTENVGERFAQEARRIHAGESDERPIRGLATRQERQALAQDGIAVVSLPDFLDTDRMH